MKTFKALTWDQKAAYIMGAALIVVIILAIIAAVHNAHTQGVHIYHDVV